MTNDELILRNMSIYLNECPDYINKELIHSIDPDNHLTNEEKVRILVSSAMNLYDNKDIMESHFKHMFKELNINDYINNPYYKNIKLNNINESNWKVKNISYKPFELFVYDDLKTIKGSIIPSIGFFTEEYTYPCVYENNREWMLITPNEINTMEKPIKESFGDVVTYGLGLGYFPYMCSLKENVKSITIVEKDENAIKLFEKYILPQFEYKDKIKIIHEDAYKYADSNHKHDYCFIDIWHDPTDGVESYLKFKEKENKNTKYSYWIEETIKYYL